MKTDAPLLPALGVLLTILLPPCLSAPLPPGGRPLERALLKGHTSGANCLAFSPDSQTLVSGGRDGTVRLWDVTTGANKATFRHPPQNQQDRPRVYSVAVSPDGKTVASSDSSTIKLWEVSSGKTTQTLRGGSENLVFSPDGKQLVAPRGLRLIWDLQANKSRPLAFLGDTTVGHPVAAFGPKGQLLIANWDCNVHPQGWRLDSLTFSLYDPETGKPITTFRGHTGFISSLAFSPDREVLASNSGDGTVRLWDVKTGKTLATYKDFPIAEGGPGGLVFSPDGKILACGYMYQGRDGRKPRRGAVRLYETATSKILATLKGSEPGPCAPVVFSPDGKLLAAGCMDKHIALWSLPRHYAPDE